MKQRFARPLCTRQRSGSRLGSGLRPFLPARAPFFRQKDVPARPIEQPRVAVEPVTRQLIAASDGIDKVEGWIAAYDVTCGETGAIQL